MQPLVTDRVTQSGCLLVCRPVCHTSEPCKNGCTDRDAVWVGDSGGPKEPCIRWESRYAMGRGNFEGGRGVPLLSIGTLHCSHLYRNCWSTAKHAVTVIRSDITSHNQCVFTSHNRVCLTKYIIQLCLCK